jgi:excisionase family DNA binding protein
MSLLVTAHLLDRYGPLLSTEDLAQVLKLDVGTIRNKMSSRELDLPRIKQGRNVLFHVDDVASLVENLRSGAGSL